MAELQAKLDAADRAVAEIRAEIGVFQDRVRDLLINLTKCPDNVIDGNGSDAGWEEFTLAEIGQGVAYVIDQRDDVRAELDEVKEGIKPLVSAIQLFVEWCQTKERCVTPEVIEAQHEALADALTLGLLKK